MVAFVSIEKVLKAQLRAPASFDWPTTCYGLSCSISSELCDHCPANHQQVEHEIAAKEFDAFVEELQTVEFVKAPRRPDMAPREGKIYVEEKTGLLSGRLKKLA